MNLTVPIEMDLKRKYKKYKKSNNKHKKYITYRKYISCEKRPKLE